MAELKERVVKILKGAKEDIEENINSTSMIADGILDSLDIMNIIIALENEFNIEIAPEDVLSENFESVGKMVALVELCMK